MLGEFNLETNQEGLLVELTIKEEYLKYTE